MSLLSMIRTYNKARKPPTCTAVIAAAGISQRCEGEDKLFYRIKEKPVLAHTIDAFQKCDLINDIIIVAREDMFEPITDICTKYRFSKVSKVMKGGQTRTESVMNGIYAASKKAYLIAVHDGARPCVDVDTITRTIKTAKITQAAAPAIPITSTVKRVENTIISETVDREELFEIQTPQVFRLEIIKAALSNVLKKSIDITDDCRAAEIIGVPVHIVEGSRRNIKITTIEDLSIAEAFINMED